MTRTNQMSNGRMTMNREMPVEIIVDPYDFVSINEEMRDGYFDNATGQYGPKKIYTIRLEPEYLEMFVWLKNFKRKTEAEEHARRTNPAVQAAYEGYLAMIKLTKEY